MLHDIVHVHVHVLGRQFLTRTLNEFHGMQVFTYTPLVHTKNLTAHHAEKM